METDEEAGRNTPALSVIITCFNRATTIGETLAGLATQRWEQPWELIFADNGSTDASISIFEAWARETPHVRTRFLDASAERGKHFALNTSVAATRAPALAIVDSDDVPGEGWLAAMGQALAVHPIVAARMDFERLNEGWARESWGDFQSRGLDRLSFAPQFVHAAGASMGMQRAVIDQIGGFDAHSGCLEDTEFCIRAQIAGFEITFVPDAVIHYRARSDLRAMFRQSYNWGYYEMNLVSRHRDLVCFAGGWRHYLRSWRRVLRYHLRRGLRPTPETMLSAAWLRTGTGRLSGQLAGILRFRVPPYRPPGEREGSA
jgi:glycosyltransferase involved in cell wall biosynthesis